jgi:hypothetical protein
MVFISGCDNDDGNADLLENILSGYAWSLESATVDGTDQTTLYSGMVLKFSAATYESVSGKTIFESNGTWLADEIAKSIEFDGVWSAQVKVISKERIVLEFRSTQTTYEPGRVVSLSGNHALEMVRQ